MVPDWIDRARVADAIERTAASKPDRPVDRVRLQTLSEGLCVQTLHVGAFDDEAELVAPERRRTLVRQPVVRAAEPGA